MIVQDVVFWLLSVAAIGAALGVVLVRDLFRAALLLVGVFVAVAGFFVLLNAEFLAVVQVLIYAGAISVLIIFAVMLTPGTYSAATCPTGYRFRRRCSPRCCWRPWSPWRWTQNGNFSPRKARQASTLYRPARW